MERLTNTSWRNFDPWACCGQDKYCQRGCHDPGGCTKGCIVPRLYKRLAAYEDTELTPESVEALKLSIMGKAITEITEFNGVPIARLKELAEADKDGRVVVHGVWIPSESDFDDDDTLFDVEEWCDWQLQGRDQERCRYDALDDG